MNEPSTDEIAGEVRERFARLAFAPQEERTFLIGADSAKTLGYDAAELDALPTCVTESFAGVGVLDSTPLPYAIRHAVSVMSH